MPWSAAAIVGGALIGGYASNKAAKKGADSADYATEVSNKQFEQNREDMAPWRQAGGVALGDITKGLATGGEFNRTFTNADFVKDPGYDFRLNEGLNALEASAAARGGVLNGANLKRLARYGQDYASTEFGNAYNRFNNDQTTRFNRLATVAGLGQTATRDVANMGTQNAFQIGQNAQTAAGARAAGTVGTANAIGGGLSSLGNWYMQQKYLNGSGATAKLPWQGGGFQSGYEGMGD